MLEAVLRSLSHTVALRSPLLRCRLLTFLRVPGRSDGASLEVTCLSFRRVILCYGTLAHSGKSGRRHVWNAVDCGGVHDWNARVNVTENATHPVETQPYTFHLLIHLLNLLHLFPNFIAENLPTMLPVDPRLKKKNDSSATGCCENCQQLLEKSKKECSELRSKLDKACRHLHQAVKEQKLRMEQLKGMLSIFRPTESLKMGL